MIMITTIIVIFSVITNIIACQHLYHHKHIDIISIIILILVNVKVIIYNINFVNRYIGTN